MEFVDHIFVLCHFSVQIWKNICKLLNLGQIWGKLPFEQNFHYWFFNYPNHCTLPTFISWGIWNSRNALLFEDKILVSNDTCVKILDMYKDYRSVERNNQKTYYI